MLPLFGIISATCRLHRSLYIFNVDRNLAEDPGGFQCAFLQLVFDLAVDIRSRIFHGSLPDSDLLTWNDSDPSTGLNVRIPNRPRHGYGLAIEHIH